MMAVMTRPQRALVTALLVGALAVVGVACSSDDADDDAVSATTTLAEGEPGTTTTEPPGVLRILVTNDDGVDAPGIDALVEALRALPDTEVTVVAPLANQSGSGGNTTPGELAVTDVTTASGYPAKAVDGYPADAILWALDQGGVEEPPDLVVSGINFGQNLGPAIEISGTVGAARAAATRGIPALAVSQGIADQPDFPSAVDEAVAWVEANRTELLARTGDEPAEVDNLNVPTCTTGDVRELVVAPAAPEAGTRDVTVVDCTSTLVGPADDIDAFINGFAVLSEAIPLG
jgi:5'-nucleotidase